MALSTENYQDSCLWLAFFVRDEIKEFSRLCRKILEGNLTVLGNFRQGADGKPS
ncbi:hypothetical protein [Sporotomaculum syntrophicum]|uniref:hypothetical protein n=1 Tax=Sporotomaculum syntrophicum TaxID=182264 RepID=UPI001379702F|nr:hypothetical protein [Sporotomaculum syntrophicum]